MVVIKFEVEVFVVCSSSIGITVVNERRAKGDGCMQISKSSWLKLNGSVGSIHCEAC